MSRPGESMPLAAGFPPADRERWMHEVRRVLTRGRDGATDEEVRALVARVLETPTYDGLTLSPLYTADDAPPPGSEGLPGLHPFTRGALPRHPGGRWDVRQPVVVAGDGAAAAGRALHELENGASSLLVDLRWADHVDAALLDRVLEGVRLDWAAVGLRAGGRGLEAAEALRAVWAERRVADAEPAGSLGLDPIGEHASAGGAGGDVREALAAAARLAAEVDRRHPRARTLLVDAARHHDAGASDAQQLAAAVATGIEYLRALTAAGLSVEAACGQIEFRLAADARQFHTIATFRAARRLWARVGEVCGVSSAARAARLHAISSRAMTTRYAPFVNLLRGTVACFAAGVGGAQVVTVEPHDATAGGDSPLGRRLARNTQSLLIDESELGRVADPAGGSWFVERLTEELAADAWRRFQEIERAGGMVAALDAGLVQRGVETTWRARRAAVSTRRDAITGVSEFPDIDEMPPAAPAAGSAPSGTPIPALVPRRHAEPFEDLRSRADRHLERTGRRPEVLLACLGTPAAHSARAGFAANLFAAAGIRPLTGAGPARPEDVGAAFAAAGGARIACICSSDEVYAEQAAAAARALAGAGAARVYLAGNPGALEDELRAAGVDRFADAGCDALELLAEALDAAGVP